MSERKLVAVMACRAGSTRLYAKPLQNLADDYCILDQKLATFAALPDTVSESVIAIAEGVENLAYQQYAERSGTPYLFGSSADILSRLVNGGLMTGATDILRVTSENPYIWWEALAGAWADHQAYGNDITATDGCPFGSYFEIIRLDALLRAHQQADGYQREACTQYFRDHPGDFRIQVITAPEPLFRLDIRLTVDFPEDLVVSRRIFEHFKAQAPLIPLVEIIRFWDQQPLFSSLVGPYTTGKGIWVNNEGCQWSPGQTDIS